MALYFIPFKNIFIFNKRARRREFWIFTGVNLSVFFVLFAISFIINHQQVYNVAYAVFILLFLILLLPWISLSIRRLHDTGHTGWLVLINLIPVLGNMIFFFMMIADSNPSYNQYGEYPKFKLVF